MKRVGLILACICMIGSLNGCAKFDASAYVKAILDNSYLNDSTEFVEQKIGTAEEAAELYKQGIDAEMDAMLASVTLSDEVQEAYREFYENMFQKVKYTVGEATKIDKNTETGNQIEDIKQNSRQIFIPDFMNGEAEKLFSQNSQTRAMKELASMEMYNYGVDIPQDGKLNVYNNPDTGTAVYQMEYSDGSTVQIGKDEALRNINKMLIIEDGIDNANSLFYDEDGNIRKGIKQNGKINANFHNDLVKKVDAYVTSAMSELYPEAWQSFKPFASYAVNGDFESEDYKTKLAKAMESFIDSSNINLINNQRAIYSSYILDNIGMNDSDMYNIE